MDRPGTRAPDDKPRTERLDRIGQLEQREAELERRASAPFEAPAGTGRAGAERSRRAKAEHERTTAQAAEDRDAATAQRQNEERGLYGHLYGDRREPPGPRTPLAEGYGERFTQMTPAERDREMAQLPSHQRDQLARQLRDGQSELDRQGRELQTRAADADPNVRAAREEQSRLRDTESDRYQEYITDFRRVRDREEGTLGHRVLGGLYSDPTRIASDATRDQYRRYQDARTAADAAERRANELARTAPLSPEAQRARADLDAKKAELTDAQQRVARGETSRADAEAWLRSTPDARNEQLANGLTPARADSLSAQLGTLRTELETAPPNETPEAKRAREAQLAEVDAAQHRLRYPGDAPPVHDFRARNDARIQELQNQGGRDGRGLNPAQRQELEDLYTARLGVDRLSPADQMHQWSTWERRHAEALAQPALQREWQEHLAQNPQAVGEMDAAVQAAREQALARLPPDQRADFEERFRLETTFGRDGEENLTYRVGYSPTQETADQQMRQALGVGMHRSQPAMEIPRYYRNEPFVRPNTPEQSIAWWQHFKDQKGADLMTRSGGGGLEPTYDEMLFIPSGSLLRFGGQTLGRATAGQFARSAAREITSNLAWDAGLNLVGNAVSNNFGSTAGAAVPFAAIAGTILTGRVMRNPRVQSATAGARERVGNWFRRPFGTRQPGGTVDVPRTPAGQTPGQSPRTTPHGETPRTGPDVAPPRGTPPRTRVPPSEPARITPEVRHTGADPVEHLELVNRHGLQPQHTVTVDNATYSFSDPIDIGHGRVAVLGVVDDGTEQTLRAFYRSNSQGNFRLLPAQNHNLGHLGLPGFDKGIGEHALGLPAAVEQKLAGLVSGGRVRADIPADDAARLFAGAAPTNRTPQEYMRYAQSPDYIGRQVEVRPLTEPVPGGELLRTSGGHRMSRPQDVQVPAGMEPRFDTPVRTYKTNTSTAGDVDAMVYQSVDGSLEYTMFKDAQNRVWVANVTAADAPITGLGVRGQAVDPGDLATPLWEYHSQIPPGFAGPAHPSLGNAYADAWPYVRELATVQGWYRAQGIAPPP